MDFDVQDRRNREQACSVTDPLIVQQTTPSLMSLNSLCKEHVCQRPHLSPFPSNATVNAHRKWHKDHLEDIDACLALILVAEQSAQLEMSRPGTRVAESI